MRALLAGDCREIMPVFGPFDMVFADPPYGDTALERDKKVRGWEAVALATLKPTGSMWVFGSMRYFLVEGVPKGFRYAQDIVWEKPNGSSFAADRFRRVHEHAIQFYRADVPWSGVYNDVQRVAYAGPNKSAKRSAAAVHLGKIAPGEYVDDGTRIVRTVLKASPPRDGKHGTQKPTTLLDILVRTSCPEGGVVADFFAGSGAAGEACCAAGRQYIGAELDPKMAARASARLREIAA